MMAMKYAYLKQIETYLAKFRKITGIKRASDMAILIQFDSKFTLFFDLSKSSSSIYSNEDFIVIKEYKAPFDIALKKRFSNSKILSVKTLENNRILEFVCVQEGSYKSVTNHLFLEFTGRFTNAIITDENGVIIEALRHIENSLRQVKPGKVLVQLEPIEIKEKEVDKISDFEQFFKDEFDKLSSKNLANLKDIKSAQIIKKTESLKESISALESSDELANQSEILSKNATIILANLHHLKDFDRELNLIDFSGQSLKFSIPDTPKNSANLFFTKSKRLKQKSIGIINERANLEEKLSFYQNLLNLIQNAKTLSELEILYPKKTQSKQKDDISDGVESFFISDYKILVGRNEKGNIALLKSAKKDDVWLHLKDIASAHVIIKTAKMSPSEEVLRFAAKLCVEFSVNGAGNYEVDYTKRANVKMNEGANVNYTDFKTIVVVKE